MTLNELIDKAKTRANLPSDYALAKALGVKSGHVSGWRKGARHPSNDEAVQLATLAGLPEMNVIAEIEYQTATTEKKKEFWKCYLEQHGITAALCMTVMAASILATPKPAQASVLQLQNYDAHFHAHEKTRIYIMRNSGRRPSSSGLLIINALLSKFAACLFPVNRANVAPSFP